MKKTLLIFLLLSLFVPVCFADTPTDVLCQRGRFFLTQSTISFADTSDGELLEDADLTLAGDVLPDSWVADAWSFDGISRFYMAEAGGMNCAVIENTSANDARYAQTVFIEPDTLYLFSCRVLAEGCVGGQGASISVGDTYASSDSVYDTNGEFVTLHFYGRSGSDQYDAEVWLRLGGYSATSTGKACFASASVTRVEEAPDGETVYDISPLTTSSSSWGEDEEETADAEPTRYTAQWIALGIFCLLLARKAVALRRGGKVPQWLLPCLFGAALVIRVAIASSIRGYQVDVNCFSAWSERMAQSGLSFYDSDMFCDYPPLYMLLLGLPGLLRSAFGLSFSGGTYYVLLKLFPILSDLALSGIVWREAKKKLSPFSAVLLACAALFSPALICDSAAWGQMDSVLILIVTLAVLCLARENYLAAFPLFAAAVLTKPQALLFAPIGLMYALLRLFQNKKKVPQALAGLGITCAVFYVVGLLFTIGSDDAGLLRPITWLIELYSGTLTSYGYITVNSLNLYEALLLNWGSLSSHPLLTRLAWCLFAFAYLYAGYLLVRSRSHRHLFLSAAVAIALIWCFGPMMHERYGMPVLILILLAYIEDHDRSLLICGAMYTFIIFMNEVLVLQGGISTSAYGHLQAAENWLNLPLSVLNVLTTLYFAFSAHRVAVSGRVRLLPAPKEEKPFSLPRLPRAGAYSLKECLVISGITLAYAAFAFMNLGTLSFPENGWTSNGRGDSVTFDLGQEQDFYMEYCGGICNTNFTVELSLDGFNWSEAWYAEYDQGQIFRWLRFVPHDAEGDTAYETDGLVHFATYSNATPLQHARYVRIRSVSSGLILYEVGFTDADGNVLPIASVTGDHDAACLADEQDTVPASPSWYNSTYFDEIYHARTAYEHLHGLSTYEWTHPPLGKVLMMVGIAIFGMCPFGWRFMGCLAGCVMLPVMYALARRVTGSKKLSLLAMLLLTFDSMHFTQTRLATIDSYVVMFIMLEYLFMLRFRYLMLSGGKTRGKVLSLALSGLMMGCACASKWTGIYSALGLAILYFVTLYEYIRASSDKAGSLKHCLALCCLCLAFFIAVPCLIYYFSYYWQMAPQGGLSVSRVWDTQVSMLNYHNGLSGDTHYFRSEWYEWPIIWWPMWYYSGSSVVPAGTVSSISCMGNPCVWWCGLAAILYWIFRSARSARADEGAKCCLIGFASQYLPWLLVPRSTFIYHYFASVPFMILLLVLAVREISRKSQKTGQVVYYALVILSFGLFAAFYPLESGVEAPLSYVKYLRWFRWYNY